MFIFSCLLEKFVNQILRKTISISKADYPTLYTLYLQDPTSSKFLSLCEYTQKTAPSDARLTMIIGCLRLLQNIPSASEAFAFLAQKYSSSLCHFLLLASHSHFAHWSLAREACTNFLRQFSPPSHPAFNKIITLLLENTSEEFFAGLSPTGKITIYSKNQDILKNFSITLDNRTLSLPIKKIKTYITLPSEWVNEKILKISYKNNFFSIDIQNFLKVRGFIKLQNNQIHGWACYDTDPERDIKLSVFSSETENHEVLIKKITVKHNKYSDVNFLKNDSEKHHFIVKLSHLKTETKYISVKTENDKHLYGSPLYPKLISDVAYLYAKKTSLEFPATFRLNKINKTHIPHHNISCCIVVPVFNGITVTENCLKQLKKFKPDSARLILVNDCSTDEKIIPLLKKYKKLIPNTEIINNEKNYGFPTAANIGMKARYSNEDIILLNSDTIVSEYFLEKFQKAAYSHKNIGTVTPFSNSATIFSYPKFNENNPLPSVKMCSYLDKLAERLWQGELPEVPTSHGFCMYIKALCLTETGLLRHDAFAQGYGEENDFSRRAAALGWRHVACPGIYVGHAEGQSFSSVKKDLIKNNLSTLNTLHPGYDTLIQSWLQHDPLLPFRRAMDIQRFSESGSHPSSVLLITHDRAGGLSRHVGERARYYITQNIHSFSLKPFKSDYGALLWKIEDIAGDNYHNIIIPRSVKALKTLLSKLNCVKAEIHSYIGHGIKKLYDITSLSIPYDIFIHDYSWFCPRITLTTPYATYCGEPEPSVCQTCLDAHPMKNTTGDLTPVKTLRHYSRAIMNGAQKIYTPSHDTTMRIKRQLRVKPTLHPWETLKLSEKPEFTPKTSGKNRHIGILGAIGPEKGYHQLLHLARLTATINAQLHFVLIGYSCNDQELLSTGVVTITGHYQEYEIPELTERYCIDWFFLPSVWPETWSYVLTQIWATLRPVIAYDIGAQAERIKETNYGTTVPLHIRPMQMLAILRNPALWATQTLLPTSETSTLPVKF